MTKECIQPQQLLLMVEKAIQLNQAYYEQLELIEQSVQDVSQFHSRSHPKAWRNTLCDLKTEAAIQHEPLDKMADTIRFDAEGGAIYTGLSDADRRIEENNRLQQIVDSGF